MEAFVGLEECFLDSPPYRERLSRCDGHLQEVEQCLRLVLKNARAVIVSSQELSQHSRAFADSLVELGRLEANRPSRCPPLPFNGIRDLQNWSDGQHISIVVPPLALLIGTLSSVPGRGTEENRGGATELLPAAGDGLCGSVGFALADRPAHDARIAEAMGTLWRRISPCQ